MLRWIHRNAGWLLVLAGLAVGNWGWNDHYVVMREHGTDAFLATNYYNHPNTSFAFTDSRKKALRIAFKETQTATLRRNGAYTLGGILVVLGMSKWLIKH